MHKLLAISTAARPTGSPPQRKLFRVSEGLFKGRLVALFKDSPDGISLTWADNPYMSWSSPQQIVNDSFDSPFSAAMDKSGNIRIVYTDSVKAVKYIKLSFAVGTWNSGSAITVVAVDDSYNPFILADSEGKLWCLFVNHQVSSDQYYYVRSKISGDDGLTWGTGSLDLGDQLSSGSPDICFVAGSQYSSCVYAVFTSGRSDLNHSVYDLDAGSWGSETQVHSGDYIDDNFDIAVSPDKKLGLAFAVSGDSGLYFKEFDGSGWSGLYVVESASTNAPQITYEGSVPRVFYSKLLGNDYGILRFGSKTGESFISADFSSAVGLFDRVFVYNDSSLTPFEDVTAAAADEIPGDIFHPDSSALISAVGDCLYLGKQNKYFCAAILISVAGAGGQVVWEYFDGAVWNSFTPENGAFHFDSASHLIYLWSDGASIPPDWQIGMVNGDQAFWIRARVIAPYTTNPVGSQIAAASEFADPVFARDGS